MDIALRELVVSNIQDIEGEDVCQCGTNCTINTSYCPHCTRHASRADEGKISADDLPHLREALLNGLSGL